MSQPAVSVRSLRSADAEFVQALSEQAFSEFSRQAGHRTLWMAEHFPCLVAERAGERVGFAVLRLASPDLAELTAIAVLESARGRGVGRALLLAVEDRARQEGAAGILLHTADANVAALELFLKRGYRIRRRLKRHYRGVFNACELVKRFF